MRRLALIVLFLSTASGMHASCQVNLGSIGGIVVNEQGQPVGKATVYANITDGPHIGKIPEAETDETGHFAIRGLEWGQYAVLAKKEEEDYPDTANLLQRRNGADCHVETT